MLHAITLLNQSEDPETFDEILSSLVPALREAPGFCSLKISDGPLMSPAGPPTYTKVIEISFESLEDFMVWVQTPTAQSQRDFMINSNTLTLYYEVNEL